MNKEYTYLNGECIIEDENGHKRLEEYTDKIDEILVEENIIETLESDLFKVRNKYRKEKNREKSIKSSKWFNLAMLITPIVAFQLTFRLLLGPGAAETMMEMHPLLTPFVKGIAVFFSITFGGAGFLTSFIDGINNQEKIRGLESEEKALERTLEEEKEKLKKLNEEKQKQISSEKFFEKEVDDLEILRDMRDYIGLYYDCGVNRKRYEKYYQEGTLEKKLSKHYTKEGIELIKEWLEEKKNAERLEEYKEHEEFKRTLSK